ncbi:RAF proto-oncogene serine threonine- kinase isoform X3 [Brachionus plicatilis]|uniref:RAF proto-oncogene serine threonine-kinase isoform X3 n=1 Tax=Brachionus plicatilis TaxID=10195 RepID=A0A3M7RZP4_BRAPC|nr:RAF proto-oncogene serine threonine- kinase isoform X3 [Brachionus plicatilis]
MSNLESLSNELEVPLFGTRNLRFDPNCTIKYGSISVVRKAYVPGLDWTVAVKNYKQQDSSSYKNEIRILKKLNHENLLRLKGILNDGDSLVVEWCYGPNLYEYFNSKQEECYSKASTNELMNIAYQISNGMEYMHSMKIIHRDLKSKNVFLIGPSWQKGTRQWKVKIGDFNLAVSIDDPDAQNIQTKCEGSLYWMAPEVINKNFINQQISDPYTFKSDVYSFGVILFELMTGEVPFKEMEPMNMALKIGRREISLNPEFSTHASQQTIDLVKQCTEHNREFRPEFAQIKNLLSKIIE